MPRFHVRRSIRIEAPPERVFDTVADFGTWTSWSPWLCAEPDARVDISDDPAAVGSIYSWKGEIVGAGEIEHKALEPGRLIDQELRFIKPFKSVSRVSFECEPTDGGTNLAWSMHGSLPFFMFFMRKSMETFIGMDYDRGLKMLKEWIETGAIQSRTTIHGVEPLEPIRMAGVRRTCVLAEIEPSMDEAFAEAERRFAEQSLPTDGEAISVFHRFDIKGPTFEYTSGYVLPEGVDASSPELSSWTTSAKRALRVEHVGDYAHLGNAWSAASQYARHKKLKQRDGAFEIYRTRPGETPPAEARTEIYMPLK